MADNPRILQVLNNQQQVQKIVIVDIEGKLTSGSDETTFSPLIAPGATLTVDVSNYNQGTFQYVIANIDTDVTLRFEGSLDGTNFYNLDVDELDQVHVANGTFSAKFEGRHKEVRLNFISETGGTAVTINAKFKPGN